MRTYEKEISKEIYDKAVANNGTVPDSAYKDIFSVSELIGYGVYRVSAFEKDGKYFVKYQRGDSCD